MKKIEVVESIEKVLNSRSSRQFSYKHPYTYDTNGLHSLSIFSDLAKLSARIVHYMNKVFYRSWI